jgi:hypothetical protein
MSGGSTTGGPHQGGNIRNHGGLTLSFVDVAGGTVNEFGAVGQGGCIYNGPGASLVARNSAITNCRACESPGLCTGGGIHTEGTLELYDTLVANNEAADVGGGISNFAAPGAVSVTLANVNVTGNTAGGSGGGINNFTGGTWTIRNSIVADNTAPSGSECDGTLTSQGYNLVEDAADCTIVGDATGVQLGVDPLLSPLLNGSWTIVQQLQDGSPAVDAGNPAEAGSTPTACELYDLLDRYPRRRADRCDLGVDEGDSLCPGAMGSGATGCIGSTAPGKGSLQLKNDADDAKDQLKWKLGSGSELLDADLGIGDSDFTLCLYDAGNLVLQAAIPGGGTCGTNPCWKDLAKGMQYKDKAASADGVTAIKAGAGVAGKSKVQVQAKGVLNWDGLPFTGPVRVLMLALDDAPPAFACWDQTFSLPKKSTPEQYQAKSD